MKRTLTCAFLSVGLALGTATLACAQTSSPGSQGSGVTNPTVVPPELRNAKPMPMPTAGNHIVVHADANRTAIPVKIGTTIEFQIKDAPIAGWTCEGASVQGTSVELINGVYKAVAPGVSTVVFVCKAPPPKPGFAGVTHLRVPLVFEFDVQ